MSIRITSIERFPIALRPVKVGYRQEDELSTLASVDTIIIRVNTDAGVSGLGEAATIRSYFNQTRGTLHDWLDGYTRVLAGRSALDVVDAHRRMDLVSGEHPPGCQPARAAIDMALHDIIGKVTGRPVYEVLGGAYRTEFELQTNLYEDTPETKAAACREYVAKGFKSLKVKIGDTVLLKGFTADNVRIEKRKLLAALEATPEDVAIDADANQSWGNAKLVVSTFEEVLRERFYGNLSVEQPLHHLDFEGHRYVRNALKIPVVLDESVVSPEAMMQIVKHQAADRIVLKLNRVGGFWKARKIATICEAACVGISLDTMPFTKLGDTALCHLAATLRDAYPIDAEGHLWFERTPFTGGLDLRDGRAVISDAPGLGVELDDVLLGEMVLER